MKKQTDKVDRRDFLKTLALGSAATIAVPSLLSFNKEESLQNDHQTLLDDTTSFPPGFLWATATASYQVEGAYKADGRGMSIWDTFSHQTGKIFNNHNGDVACDMYNLYKEDVRLMKDLSIKAFRFSIAWSRIFPDGIGKPNPKGIDFYNRLVDELLQNDIIPFATLYHWDLPQTLQDKYNGWMSKETSKAFGEYAGYVAGKLGDRVKHFLRSMNSEPSSIWDMAQENLLRVLN